MLPKITKCEIKIKYSDSQGTAQEDFKTSIYFNEVIVPRKYVYLTFQKIKLLYLLV